MDGSHSLLIRSDSSLALRCRKGAMHPIIQSPRRRGRAGGSPRWDDRTTKPTAPSEKETEKERGAMTIAIAPGGPGSRPTWTSSAKDMVTTALGTSRVWVTLGYGILNEVYWPATGLPQIRDLGFIVAGPSEWFEVKRVNRYHVSMPDDWVPLPQVAHEGDGYRLLIEVLPDPSRDRSEEHTS